MMPMFRGNTLVLTSQRKMDPHADLGDRRAREGDGDQPRRRRDGPSAHRGTRRTGRVVRPLGPLRDRLGRRDAVAHGEGEDRRAAPARDRVDSIGASETGYQGTFAGADDQGSPRFAMGDHTTVLDDDGDAGRHPATVSSAGSPAGGYVPIGYYKDPEKTASVVRRDRTASAGSSPATWRWSRPTARITLLGRGSVSINTGGEKVFPEEVEHALKSHPDVFDVVVVGRARRAVGRAGRRGGEGPCRRRRRRRTISPRTPASTIAGYKVPARGAPRRRGRALTVGQGRLPLGQGDRDRRDLTLRRRVRRSGRGRPTRRRAS